MTIDAPRFESGSCVQILSGEYRNQEAELENPLGPATWVVLLENGERALYLRNDLKPVISMAEKFCRFLES